MASPERFFVKDQYLIFRQQGFDFALDQSQFEQPFRLDLYSLSPTTISSALWEYQSLEDEKNKGMFLHFGVIMGFTPITLFQRGMVYTQKNSHLADLGLYIDHSIGYMPKEKLEPKKREVGEIRKMPPNMPTTAIRWYLPWRGRKLFLIEPERIFEAYQIMEAGKVYLLADALKAKLSS